MTVQVAIEAFVRIPVYLRENAIYINIVIVTALIAIARKAVILDSEQVEPEYLWCIASMVFASNIGCWVVFWMPLFDLTQSPGKRKRCQNAAHQNESASLITAWTNESKPE